MAEREVLLGLYSARRADGHRLHDGNAAACLIEDHEVVALCAIGEERLSGIKHGDGFSRAAKYCLASVGYRDGDDVHVAFSSSLDCPWATNRVRAEVTRTIGIDAASVATVGHHESHGMLAFLCSGARAAAVVIIDGAGNHLGDGTWETQSHFDAGYENGLPMLELIERQYTDGRGHGQLFRGATKHLGFGSYHHASKVMALAGVARRMGLAGSEGVDRGTIESFVHSIDPQAPRESFGSALRRLFPGRFTGAGTTDRSSSRFRSMGRASLCHDDLDLALFVQAILEDHLLESATAIVRRGEVSALCLGGGVAMNCVAVGRVSASLSGVRVSVPSAPSDEGQGLGCLSVLAAQRGVSLGHAVRNPFLGHSSADFRGVPSTPERLANALLSGSVVARFGGSSEYGPRALGHRSILAASGVDGSSDRLDRLRSIKQREDFQPFGLTMRLQDAQLLGVPESPYMSIATRPSGRQPDSVAEVAHDDMTVRVQTLERAMDPELWDALSILADQGVVGVVNTSMNERGKPLVESAAQAARFFVDHRELDLGVIDGQWGSRV